MADATIIMAGGSGTRLWPASTSTTPKQLLRIGGSVSLIQQALIRAMAATPEGPIVIVTHVDQVASIQDHVEELSTRQRSDHGVDTAELSGRTVFLPEPVGRNTAPAIALGVSYIRSVLDDSARVLVLTADHVIRPVDQFARDAESAATLAAAGYLVCFGIAPDRPETGYGYIKAGPALGSGRRVEGFTEKPDEPTAERYLSDGDYLWNSGMFCFTAAQFWSELAMHEPAIVRAFEAHGMPGVTAAASGIKVADAEALRPLYEELPRISIDYALMERSSRVGVVPATFEWSDVGSWDEVARLAPAGGAVGSEPVIEIESTGNYVDSDLPVAICGLDDLHVVVRNGCVLVCRRGSSQLVKNVVEHARTAGYDQIL